MNVFAALDHEAASGALAHLIWETLVQKPSANFVVATGNTPMRAYEMLAGQVDCSAATAFQLDEYVGVPTSDERSLYDWMLRKFVTPLGFGHSRQLAGYPADLDFAEVGRLYDLSIEDAGGIDLCILGLGPNGHLGFNEPPSEPDSVTRLVTLTPESLVSNAVYWSQSVPTHALTVGMTQLLASRKIVLIATGERKREILAKTLSGPITPDVPASQLQLVSDRVVVIADGAALGG